MRDGIVHQKILCYKRTTHYRQVMKPKILILLGSALVTSSIVALSATVSLPTKALAITYPTASDGSVQDFHIDKNGKVKVNQAKVMQVSGTTFYARYYMGLAFIRMLIKTNPNTKVFRKFGDEIPLNQIVAGDTINIEGEIESGADNLSVIAHKLTNFSNQKAIDNFRGVISAIGSTTRSFILTAKNDVLMVTIGTTTQIKKGNRIISTDLIRNGDIVTDAVGTYDHKTKILDANVVVIYIDKNIFAERNFEGTLKSISTGSTPTLTVNTEGKDYSIILTSDTTIINKNRKPVSVKRYLEGDTVRIYGAIREAEEPIIDAQIVRNIDLQ